MNGGEPGDDDAARRGAACHPRDIRGAAKVFCRMRSRWDRAAVPAGMGERCPKCGKLMVRWQHSAGWQPPIGRGFYTRWDVCRPCGHVQHYERFLRRPNVDRCGVGGDGA